MESFFYILQHYAGINPKIEFTKNTSIMNNLSNPNLNPNSVPISNYQLLFYMKTIHDKYEENQDKNQNQKKTNQYPLQEYIKQKFKNIDVLFLDNIFMKKEEKEKIEFIFFKTQRTYYILKRAIYNYRFKKAPIKINTDLCLNIINTNHINTFILFKNKVKYCFTIRDLIHIITNAITNSFEFFTAPMEPKNPYTNIPFTKTDLYNIYFSIRNSTYMIPPLISSYFIENFDLKPFSINNESSIREYTIKKYVSNSTTNVLYNEIIDMINDHFESIITIVTESKNTTNSKIEKVTKRINKVIKISDDFPKEKLVNIMRPYLYMYLISNQYIIGTEKTILSKRIFKHMVKRFVKFNPNFGRKNIKNIICPMKEGFSFLSKTKIKTEYFFNDEHPSMTLKEAENLFSNFNIMRFENDFFTNNTNTNINQPRTRSSNERSIPTTRSYRNRNLRPRPNEESFLIDNNINFANIIFEIQQPQTPRPPTPPPINTENEEVSNNSFSFKTEETKQENIITKQENIITKQENNQNINIIEEITKIVNNIVSNIIEKIEENTEKYLHI
jgi:hypothetical protein